MSNYNPLKHDTKCQTTIHLNKILNFLRSYSNYIVSISIAIEFTLSPCQTTIHLNRYCDRLDRRSFFKFPEVVFKGQMHKYRKRKLTRKRTNAKIECKNHMEICITFRKFRSYDKSHGV